MAFTKANFVEFNNMLAQDEENAMAFNAFSAPSAPSQLHRMDASVIDPTGLENAFAQMSMAAHNTGVSKVLTSFTEQLARVATGTPAARLMVANAIPDLRDRISKVFSESVAQNDAVTRNVSALAPVINFQVPEWSLASVYTWANTEKVRHEFHKDLSWRPVPAGKVHIDTRADRPADPVDVAATRAQPGGEAMGPIYDFLPAEQGRAAQAEIAAVLGDGGGPAQEYVPAMPPKPSLPARRGYPAIVTGAPLAYEGPNPKEQEKNLLVYSHPDYQDQSHLDIVATLLAFETHANKSGYTKPLLITFLRDLVVRKSGTRAFNPYEQLEPNEIAARLVGIHFTPPPLNKIQDVVEFVRPVGESINQTYNKLKVMYLDVLHHIHDEETRKETCADRIYHDILTLTNPILAKTIKQLRLVDTVNQKAHPIEQDLYLINQIEELKPAFRHRADLKLTQRDIDRLPHHLDLNAVSMLPAEQLTKAFPEHAAKAQMFNQTDNFAVDLNMTNVNPSFTTNASKRKPDTQLTPDISKRQDQSNKENPMSTAPTIPRRMVVAGRRLANRSTSSERSPEEVQKEAMNVPLPNTPSEIKADPKSGRTTWYDAEALNRYSQSPSGRVHHYAATGDNKKGLSFNKIRTGFPGTKGDIAEMRAASREKSQDRQNNRWQDRAAADKRKASAFGNRPSDTRTFSRNSSRDNEIQRSNYYRPGEKDRRSQYRSNDHEGTSNRHGYGNPSRSRFDSRQREQQWQSQRDRSESPFRRNERSNRDRTRTPIRTQPEDVLNIINMDFWGTRKCNICNTGGHPSSLCSTIRCNRCGYKGDHRDEVHCVVAREAYYRGKLAFVPRPPRRDRSNDSRDMKPQAAANTVMPQTEYQANHVQIMESIQNLEARITKQAEAKN